MPGLSRRRDRSRYIYLKRVTAFNFTLRYAVSSTITLKRPVRLVNADTVPRDVRERRARSSPARCHGGGDGRRRVAALS